jgi:phage host-nuclease inhibitor protein Gam
VEVSAKAHPEWFPEGKKSVELPHGRIGFRLCPPAIRLLKKVESVIAALRGRKLADAIIVKESVNKDVLATYGDDLLKDIGAKRIQASEFYIDLAAAPVTKG